MPSFPRHWHGEEGVPKCFIFYVRLILGVAVVSKKFFGLKYFSLKIPTAKCLIF